MTLIVAADVQDHLLLAGDHCAVLSRVSNEGPPDVVIDNYRKLYPWKYGAIASSGDVFLMVYFCRMFWHQAGRRRPFSLLQVARDAKAARSGNGIDPGKSNGNLFFTLPGREGFELHLLAVEKDTIEREILEPLNARFSMREEVADEDVCNEFTSRLRPSFYFRQIDEFQRHHLDLLQRFYLRHSTRDERVTASFDACLLHKRTGVAMFWHVSETPKQLAFVQLPEEGHDAGLIACMSGGSDCLPGSKAAVARIHGLTE